MGLNKIGIMTMTYENVENGNGLFGNISVQQLTQFLMDFSQIGF